MIWFSIISFDWKQITTEHTQFQRLICSFGSNHVRSSMFDHSKPKIGCSSSVTNRWTRSSSFDVRKLMFDKMVFDPSLWICRCTNQRIAGLSLIFQTFRKGYNNPLKNMFFVMIRLFDYFDICKICHYYASANQPTLLLILHIKHYVLTKNGGLIMK